MLPNPGMAFTPFDILLAEELNDIVENIESLSDGTGIADAAVTASKIDFTTFSGTTTQWRDWTTTLTNFTGTVDRARYTITGKTCEFYIEVTQGGSVSGRHTFSLPVQAASTVTPAIGFGTPIAHGTILD